MRCSSPRRAVVGGLSWICVLVSGLFASARADHSPRQAAQAIDHPFAVVALASFDRVVARAASLGEAIGRPEAGDSLLVSFLGGDDGFRKLFNSPAFDTTRPVGIMSFPKWFSGEIEDADKSDEKTISASGSVDLFSWTDLFDDPFSFLAAGIMENATIAICLPAKDREQLLATICEVMGEKFNPIAGRQGWFEPEQDKDTRIVFVGRYVLIIADDGKVKQWDRNYPDFEKLAKSSLGQNGFAYSLYRRGLPKLVREDMVDALKTAYATTLQRYDDEPEAAFKFRTMFGPLMTESLDLLLSQIEEFRITGHVDPDSHQVLVDTELIGPKDGKLAKLTNAMTTKSSLFGSISTDDALFAINISLPLSTKLWKPVAESIRSAGETTIVVANQQLTWLPDLTRVFAKTIEAGQLELHASYTHGGEGLLALRIAGNAAFPEQVQAALETFTKLHDDAIHVGTVKLAADSVESWPVHRVRATILDDLEFGDFGWSNLTPNDARPVVAAKFKRTTEDGKTVEIGETPIRVPAAEGEPQNYVWVVATPSGLWLALSTPDKREFPEWCRSAVAASLAKPTSTASRGNVPVRLLLRGLGASPAAKDSADDTKVTQAAAIDIAVAKKWEVDKVRKPLTAEQLAAQAAAAEQQKRQEQQERERGDLLRDGANAIRVELRPTANGLRARTTFDDAYFHWFATMMKHSLDEQSVHEVPHHVEPPQPAPPLPPKRLD
jgi:hypothetical protein